MYDIHVWLSSGQVCLLVFALWILGMLYFVTGYLGHGSGESSVSASAPNLRRSIPVSTTSDTRTDSRAAAASSDPAAHHSVGHLSDPEVEMSSAPAAAAANAEASELEPHDGIGSDARNEKPNSFHGSDVVGSSPGSGAKGEEEEEEEAVGGLLRGADEEQREVVHSWGARAPAASSSPSAEEYKGGVGDMHPPASGDDGNGNSPLDGGSASEHDATTTASSMRRRLHVNGHEAPVVANGGWGVEKEEEEENSQAVELPQGRREEEEPRTLPAAPPARVNARDHSLPPEQATALSGFHNGASSSNDSGKETAGSLRNNPNNGNDVHLENLPLLHLDHSAATAALVGLPLVKPLGEKLFSQKPFVGKPQELTAAAAAAAGSAIATAATTTLDSGGGGGSDNGEGGVDNASHRGGDDNGSHKGVTSSGGAETEKGGVEPFKEGQQTDVVDRSPDTTSGSMSGHMVGSHNEVVDGGATAATATTATIGKDVHFAHALLQQAYSRMKAKVSVDSTHTKNETALSFFF
jgi:hypothetical protein